MNWRKWLRILHRDTGYFIVGITLIYCISGILLNHRSDFNPNLKITIEEVQLNLPSEQPFAESDIKNAIESIGDYVVYKKSYITRNGDLKAFIENGEVVVDAVTGKGVIEYLKRRPVFFEMNQLHKMITHRSWKWISDLMAVILIFVTISGIFILKGKNSFIKRGIWFIIAGLIAPVLFMIFLI